MNRLFSFLLILATAPGMCAAADSAAPVAPAAPAVKAEPREVTDLLEKFVSWLHHFYPSIDDGLFHWIACGVLFIAAILLRHIITNVIFHYLKKLAEKTETTLDDKLFPALEAPAATLVITADVPLLLTIEPMQDNTLGTRGPDEQAMYPTHACLVVRTVQPEPHGTFQLEVLS